MIKAEILFREWDEVALINLGGVLRSFLKDLLIFDQILVKFSAKLPKLSKCQNLSLVRNWWFDVST